MSYAIKVRLPGEYRWYFLGSSGRLTRLRVHAGLTDDRARAEEVASSLLADNSEEVAATRVVSMEHQGKVLAHYGEPTPPKPAPFDFSPYRYLVAIRGRRGTFHARDADGGWANVSEAVYEACYEEARRAGLDTSPLTIHGCIATIITKGLRFVQRSNREGER